MTAILLLLIVAGSFLLRTAPVASGIFLPAYVRFQGSDAWYHVRLIENLVRNFPHFVTHDPYGRFPDGQEAAVAPFFDLLLAGFIRLVHGADASTAQIHLAAAWYPAILGSLVPVAVFLLGRRLFGNPAGLIAAAMVSVMPSTLLLRSALGFTDHHVLEALLGTLFFLILATAPGYRGEGAPARPGFTLGAIVSGIGAGLVLAVYLWTWIGGGVLVFILFAFTLVQGLLNHLRGSGLRELGLQALLAAGVALLLVLPGLGVVPLMHLQVAALAVTVLLAGGLLGLSEFCARIRAPRWGFPAAVLAAFAAGVAVFRLAAPDLFATLTGMIATFTAR